MKAYTDGATSNNGYNNARGGWAYIIIDDDNHVISKDSGHIEPATNNICELTAIINACKIINNPSTQCTIYSDSAYAINCYKQGWYKKWQTNNWINSKKQLVANRELWEELIPFFNNPNFNFEKVQGHASDKWNNIVDQMAVEAKQC